MHHKANRSGHHRLSRREFVRWTVLTGTAAAFGPWLLASCAPQPKPSAEGPAATAPQAAGPSEIVVGFDGGSWQKFHDEVVSQPFAKLHNVKITYDVGTESDRLTKMIAQKDNPMVDCAKFGTNIIDRAVTSGVLDKMDLNIVTNWHDIHPFFRNEYWCAGIVATFGLAYRTDKLPDGIDSWWDLWDSKLKGRVGLPNFDWMGEQFLMIVNTLAGGTPDNVDKGIAKLKEYMANDPVMASNTDHGMQLFTSGEVWAMPFWDGRVRQLQANGVPVKFVFPKEGSSPLGFGLAFGWRADPRELTLKYLNYALEPDVQIEFSRRTQYPPTNLKALERLPDDLKAIAIPREHMDNMLRIDYLESQKHVDMYMERWNKEITR